jgi:AcrR family transcriptional regulator
MRADARRNYDKLLREAASTFADLGIDASLDDIARRAGVGPGTLYRHFPTRLDLLEAVFADASHQLIETADALLQAPSAEAEAALTGWLRALVQHTATFRGLPETLLSSSGDPDSPLYETCGRLRGSGTALLTRAQEAGAVRPSVLPDDLFSLAHAMAVTVELKRPADRPAQLDRMLDLLLSGLRP